MESEVRKRYVQQIEVPYSGSTENSYQVIINGIGLNGYSTLQLKPNSKNYYQL